MLRLFTVEAKLSFSALEVWLVRGDGLQSVGAANSIYIRDKGNAATAAGFQFGNGYFPAFLAAHTSPRRRHSRAISP